MRNTSMKFGTFAITTALVALPLFAQQEEPADQRLQRAATVFSEIMAAPDKGIPRDLLDKAECAIVIPSLKAGPS